MTWAKGELAGACVLWTERNGLDEGSSGEQKSSDQLSPLTSPLPAPCQLPGRESSSWGVGRTARGALAGAREWEGVKQRCCWCPVVQCAGVSGSGQCQADLRVLLLCFSPKVDQIWINEGTQQKLAL